MNLQDTVAFYGNLGNIATALGGLVMALEWWCRRRRTGATGVREPGMSERAPKDTVTQLHGSAYEVRQALSTATDEALREQA